MNDIDDGASLLPVEVIRQIQMYASLGEVLAPTISQLVGAVRASLRDAQTILRLRTGVAGVVAALVAQRSLDTAAPGWLIKKAQARTGKIGRGLALTGSSLLFRHESLLGEIELGAI